MPAPGAVAGEQEALSGREPARSSTRYHARWILPITSPPLQDGTVCVDGDRISYVGPRAAAPVGRDIDLGDVVLAPGLVNAHTHLDLTAFRGLLAGLPFFSWVRSVVAMRAELTEAELLGAARAGIAEGLLCGVTTYADTAPSSAPFEAMLEMGVRGIAYREVFGPDPLQCAASLGELRQRVDAMRALETGLVRTGVSPHAPYSVSDALFSAVADYARRERLPLATHIAESADEFALVSEAMGPFADLLRSRGIVVTRRGRSPVALLQQAGVLGESTLLIHCVRCDADDISAIVEHRCGVATCPSSNTRLLDRMAPVAALRAAGVRLGVGSDSMASNDKMDVLRESVLTARDSSRGETESVAKQAWHLATIDGARALGMEERIGSLDVGKQADLAAFDAATMLEPWNGAEPRRARLVLVAGDTLVRDGNLVTPVPGAAGATAASSARLRLWLTTRGERR